MKAGKVSKNVERAYSVDKGNLSIKMRFLLFEETLHSDLLIRVQYNKIRPGF